MTVELGLRNKYIGAVFVMFALSGCPNSNAQTNNGIAGFSGSITAGKTAVEQRKCADCHGAADGSLSGQTTPRPDTNAFPANLTPDSDTGLGDWDEALIVRAIRTGIDDEDEALCTTMPHFAEMGMSETEARDIAAYLHSLPGVKHEVPESECPPIKGGESESDAGL
ncbi:MAG TPA: cytochrome c [Polyangiales bacterium]|jgi:cytochrome c553|nr:cytochrome c [Polyangiales bacterium]